MNIEKDINTLAEVITSLILLSQENIVKEEAIFKGAKRWIDLNPNLKRVYPTQEKIDAMLHRVIKDATK